MSSNLKKCTFSPCAFTTFHPTTLRDHLTTHTGEKPYKCDFDGCNVALTTSGALSRHQRLENHIKNKVICDCGYITVSERGLKIHKYKSCKLIHTSIKKIMIKPSFISPPIKKMKCNNCNFNDIPDNLLKHMKSNVCNWSKVEVISYKVKNILNKKFNCTICTNYSTNFNWSMKRHLDAHNNIYNFKCNYCNYKTVEKSHLNRHMKCCYSNK